MFLALYIYNLAMGRKSQFLTKKCRIRRVVARRRYSASASFGPGTLLFELSRSRSEIMAVSDQQSSSQWIFPVSALLVTPSLTTSNFNLERELYDRSRGAEFLFRLGSSLGLSVFATYVRLGSSNLMFSQAVDCDVYCCDVVSPFLHALFVRGLSPPSKP